MSGRVRRKAIEVPRAVYQAACGVECGSLRVCYQYATREHPKTSAVYLYCTEPAGHAGNHKSDQALRQ